MKGGWLYCYSQLVLAHLKLIKCKHILGSSVIYTM